MKYNNKGRRYIIMEAKINKNLINDEIRLKFIKDKEVIVEPDDEMPLWFKKWSETVYQYQPPHWFKIWSETVYQHQQPQWFKEWNENVFEPRISRIEARMDQNCLKPYVDKTK